MKSIQIYLELEVETEKLNVSSVSPIEKNNVIFQKFNTLRKGDKLELINNHDPKALYKQFCEALNFQFHAVRSEQFRWDYLEAGPDLWRVNITRIV